MYENLYENITNALINDGYLVIENALEPLLAKELRTTALQLHYKQAGISHASALDRTKRKDKIHWLDGENESTCKYLAFAQGLQNYLNRHLYLGLRYYESHFAMYEEGDFYEKHLDAFKNSKNRVVTTVFYLNGAWNTDDGGELIIYDKDDAKIQKVIPKGNTLVVFMSEDFPYEVIASKRQRHSIAGWYRIDDI